MNTRRGMLAEFLVARAVGCPEPRVEWDPYDVKAPDGTTIEVKSGAYIQAWRQGGPSKIIFSGLKGRLLDEHGGFSGGPGYNAEVYVFAVQTCQDHDAFEVLDLAQWEFFVAPRTVVAATGYRSLSLPAVRAIAGPPVRFEQLAGAIAAARRGEEATL